MRFYLLLAGAVLFIAVYVWRRDWTTFRKVLRGDPPRAGDPRGRNGRDYWQNYGD